MRIKLSLLNILFVVFLIISMPAEETQGVIDTGLTVEDVEAQAYDVNFGLVKLTESGIATFGVYQNRANELVFLNKDTVLQYESIQFQFYNIGENSNITELQIRIYDYAYYENRTYHDLINRSKTVVFNDGFGYIDLVLSQAEEERKILIFVEDIRFFFSHITSEQNLFFDENITNDELVDRFLWFGGISALIALVAGLAGVKVDEKAREIPIPDKARPALFFGFGVSITLTSALGSILGVLIVNQVIFFVIVAFIAFWVGVAINTVEFIEYIGFERKYINGKEKRRLYTVRLYRVGKKYAVALDGFWESMARLAGFHVYFEIVKTHSIDVDGYEAGFELDDQGKRKGEERFSRIWEWVTVAGHKLPSRIVQDYNQRIEYYEIMYKEKEKEFNDLKTSMKHEISREVSLIYEEFFAKMGQSSKKAKSYPKEIIEAVAKIMGVSEKEVKEALKEDRKYFEKNGKVKTELPALLNRFGRKKK